MIISPEAVDEPLLDQGLRQPAVSKMCSSPSRSAFNARTASAASPARTWASFQSSGLESIVVATYFGSSFNGPANPLLLPTYLSYRDTSGILPMCPIE
jgi:hypothetical protein